MISNLIDLLAMNCLPVRPPRNKLATRLANQLLTVYLFDRLAINYPPDRPSSYELLSDCPPSYELNYLVLTSSLEMLCENISSPWDQRLTILLLACEHRKLISKNMSQLDLKLLNSLST